MVIRRCELARPEQKVKQLLCTLLLVLCSCLLLGCGQEQSPQNLENRGISQEQHKQELVYKTIAQADGKPMGVPTGTLIDNFTSKYLPTSPHNYYNSYTDCLVALKTGKVEGFLCDEPVAREMERVNPDIGFIKEAVQPDMLGIGINKDKSELKSILDAGITRYQKDGTFKKLDEIWFGSDDSLKKAPDYKEGTKGTIICAVSAENPPLSYIENGKVTGFEVVLVTSILQDAGYTVKIQPMDFNALIPSVVSGKADLLFGSVSITEERKQSMLFSDPDYSSGIVLVVKKMHLQTQKPGFIAELKESFRRNFLLEDRYKMVLDGLKTTLYITLCAAVLGTILGLGVCMLRRSANKLVSTATRIFIKVMQGTPLVVFLMIMYYIVFGKVSINPIYVAIVAFAVNMAAYSSEMMRTGIEAVDKGQLEAATAMGFTKVQAFIKIVAPQALRHIIPVYTGELISMMKMTSVVGYIAIQDLTKMSDIIRSRTYEAFFPLIVTALIYLVVSWILSSFLVYLEYRIDPKKRPRTLKGVKL